jgi:Rrf2 family protein
MCAPGEPVLLTTIAEAVAAPPNYLSNIFQNLTRLGFVTSHRGARRGYALARPPEEINLLEVVEAMEGPITISSLDERDKACECDPVCRLDEVFEDIRSAIDRRFSEVNLKDVGTNCHASLG